MFKEIMLPDGYILYKVEEAPPQAEGYVKSGIPCVLVALIIIVSH
jgi:hypothetical protein